MKTDAEPTVQVRVARRFAAAAERVFDAWLDPASACRWLFVTPTGQMTRVEIDARVGGRFCIVRRDGDDVEHVGEYLEFDRPHRIVFTFSVPKYSTIITRVTIDIASGDHGCELTLTHDGVLASWAAQSEQGWRGILEGLAKAL